LSYQFTIKQKGYEVIFTAVEKEEQFLERFFFTKLESKPIYASSFALDEHPSVIGQKSFNKCFYSKVKVANGTFALVIITAKISKEGKLKSAESLISVNKKLSKKALKAFLKCGPDFKPPTINGHKVQAEIHLTYLFR